MTQQASTLPPSGRAFVKSVLSGDGVVLRGKPQGGPPPEKILSFANVIAPRLGTPGDPGKEEIGAFESREYLRKMLIGKEVAYRVEYTTTSNNRDFGALFLQPPGVDGETSVTRLLVKDGWVKVKQGEQKRPPSDEQTALQELEAASQAGQLGIWAQGKPARNFSYNNPEDVRGFFEKHKGKQLDAIVDQVRDGSTFRVCLIIDESGQKSYQYVTLSLTGIKAPTYRQGVPNVADLVEPYSEEAKYFSESRLLQRDVKVVLEGVSGSNGFVGTIIHPAGNISEALLAEGYAQIVSWNISLVGSGAAKYRAAEEKAKEKRMRLWKNFVAKSREAGAPESEFDGVVVKIATADTIHVVPSSNPDGPERKITFASLRAPRQRDEKEAFYNHEAKEHLRAKLIGKTVHVVVDFVKPADGEFPERECATVTYQGANLSEVLIARGLAVALRHRKDDDNRASNYDALLQAEEKAKAANKGMHSTKDVPPLRIQDASENAAKAKGFLSFLQRSGTITAIVDHITSASRFKIWIPSQNTKITLVLAGIRAPKPGRTGTKTSTSSEKPEPFGPEALDFISRRALQREVEVSIEGVDKVGGFIGNLFLTSPSRQNVACLLLENGLATVHDYSASQSVYANAFYGAEKAAQAKRIGIWSVRDPVAEAAAKEAADAVAMNGDDGKVDETKEVYVSEIGGEGKVYVQIVGPELTRLETLMTDFANHHAQASSQPIAPVHPKVGEHVAAKFSVDDAWYRAKVTAINDDKTISVVFIDYGNSETLKNNRLRPLDGRFAVVNLPAQAHEAKLALVTVPKLDADYGDSAYERLREETEGRKMVARVMGKSSEGMQILLEPTKGAASLNEMLVEEGLATVEKSLMRRFERDLTLSSAPKGSRKAIIAKLLAAQEQAKKARLALWRYGDFMGEDEL
ncbi:hypothetical protein HK101_008094 [Irineochytrium annulatum]|nr:hypothetical protein HK101_008094 [Irineochytrium annulatum]